MALTRFSKSNCKKLCSWKITGISAVHPSLQILTLNQARPSEKYGYKPHCFDPWANGDGWGNVEVGVEFNGWNKNHSFLLGSTFGNKSRVSISQFKLFCFPFLPEWYHLRHPDSHLCHPDISYLLNLSLFPCSGHGLITSDLVKCESLP